MEVTTCLPNKDVFRLKNKAERGTARKVKKHKCSESKSGDDEERSALIAAPLTFNVRVFCCFLNEISSLTKYLLFCTNSCG